MYGADWSYSYWAVAINPIWIANPTDARNIFIFLHNGYNSTDASKSGGGCVKNAYTDFDLDTATYPNSTGAVKFLHLKEGIERFMITDINNAGASAKAQSSIAVQWDTIRLGNGSNFTPGQSAIAPNDFCHVPGGANILFMDGHVEFSKYPSTNGGPQWPTSQAVVNSGAAFGG